MIRCVRTHVVFGGGPYIYLQRQSLVVAVMLYAIGPMMLSGRGGVTAPACNSPLMLSHKEALCAYLRMPVMLVCDKSR